MKLILLLPILLYLVILLLNFDLVSETKDIDLIFTEFVNMPIYLFSGVFFTWYAIILFFIYDFYSAYLHNKIDELDVTIIDLKSKLYDWQEKLLWKIKTDIEASQNKLRESDIKLLDDHKKINEKLVEEVNKSNNKQYDEYKKDLEKVLHKISFIDEGVWEKIKKMWTRS